MTDLRVLRRRALSLTTTGLLASCVMTVHAQAPSDDEGQEASDEAWSEEAAPVEEAAPAEEAPVEEAPVEEAPECQPPAE